MKSASYSAPGAGRCQRSSLIWGLLASCLLASHQAQAQTLTWSTSYSGISASALEEVEGVVVDAAGNVFATGLSGNKTGSTICTMKLSPAGKTQWILANGNQSLCGGMWGRTPLALDP